MKIAIIGSKSYFGKNLCNFFFKKKIKLIKIKRTTNFNIKNNSFKSLDNVKNCNYLIYLAHDYSKNSSENNIRAIKKILKLKNYNKFRKIIYVSSMSAHVNTIYDEAFGVRVKVRVRVRGTARVRAGGGW